MLRAISKSQDEAVEADVWMVEGLDSQGACGRIVAMAWCDGRANVGCIVLGRSENGQHVRAWLNIAAGVAGFIGFAVGRTTFCEPLIAWRDEQITRDAAALEIARRYRQWVGVLQAADTAAPSADPASATAFARWPKA